MWGISDDDIYVSIERGIKGRMHEREGVPNKEFIKMYTRVVMTCKFHLSRSQGPLVID